MENNPSAPNFNSIDSDNPVKAKTERVRPGSASRETLAGDARVEMSINQIQTELDTAKSLTALMSIVDKYKSSFEEYTEMRKYISKIQALSEAGEFSNAISVLDKSSSLFNQFDIRAIVSRLFRQKMDGSYDTYVGSQKDKGYQSAVVPTYKRFLGQGGILQHSMKDFITALDLKAVYQSDDSELTRESRPFQWSEIRDSVTTIDTLINNSKNNPEQAAQELLRRINTVTRYDNIRKAVYEYYRNILTHAEIAPRPAGKFQLGVMDRLRKVFIQNKIKYTLPPYDVLFPDAK